MINYRESIKRTAVLFRKGLINTFNYRELLLQLTRRDIAGRYKGSIVGVAWSLLTPLFMLSVYTFVFGTIFNARLTDNAKQDTVTLSFAVPLFAGLIIYQLFAEVVNRAPTLVLSNVNYVKKVVFPLELLVPVALGSALFHAAVSFIVLLAFKLAADGSIPVTALWLPVLLMPFCLVILGFGWMLASLGVFFRDITQLTGTIVTALMFLSPIFFPISALPERLRWWINLNPIAYPVEEARNVLLKGDTPNVISLASYSALALVIMIAGYKWFQRTRGGFADVL